MASSGGERRRREGRAPDLAALAALLAIVVVVFFEGLTPTDKLVYGIDGPQHYSAEWYNRHALAQGQLPLWNPYPFSGFPALADYKTLLFYPPHVVLRPLLPLNLFFAWSTALHVWLAGAGVYVLCRQVGTRRWAAFGAAVGLMLGGTVSPRVYAGHLNVVYAFSWLPLALALTMRSVERRRVAPHPGLVCVLVLQFLAGFVQAWVYTLACVILYHLYAWLWPPAAAPGSGRAARPLWQLGCLLALCVGLGAFQMLPTLRLIAEASRADGVTYDYATKGSLLPRHLITLLFPTALAGPHTGFEDGFGGGLWEKSPYVGMLLIGLAPLALAARASRRVVVFFVVVALGTLGVAFGRHLPLYALHFHVLPAFRIPGRLLFLWSLAIAVLGAIGLDHVFRRAGERAGRARGETVYLVTLGVIVLALGARGLMADLPTVAAGGSTVLGTPLWLAVLEGLGMVAVGWVACRRHGRHVAAFLAVALITVDLYVFASQFVRVREPGPREHGAVADALRSLPVGRVLSLFAPCSDTIAGHELTTMRVPAVDGYNAFIPASYARYVYLVEGREPPPRFEGYPRLGKQGMPPRVDLLSVMNVTHVLTCAPLEQDGFGLVERAGRWAIYENSQAWPRAFWTCDATRVTGRHQAAELLKASDASHGRAGADAVTGQGRRGADEAQVVVLGREACEPGGHVRVLTMDTPRGELSLEVSAPRDGLVFISEAYFPERRARVDGRDAVIHRANLAFSAVPVAAGTHRVELRYVPTSFYVGSVVSGLTLAGWVGGAVAWRRRSRDAGPAPEAREAPAGPPSEPEAEIAVARARFAEVPEKTS